MSESASPPDYHGTLGQPPLDYHETLEPRLPSEARSDCHQSAIKTSEDDTPETNESLRLERRGVTSHPITTRKVQKPPLANGELWKKQTIHKNSVSAKLRTIGWHHEADKLELCHTEFTVAQCTGCKDARAFPNRCDQFYCPECQPRLSHDREKAVKWWTQTIAQPKHVVLTVRNIPDFTKGHVREFKKWFTRLRRMKFARNWRGGFYSLEVTNEGKGWHLHLHALVDAHWIDQQQLSDAWNKANGGAGFIVKVKDARGTDYLRELTKYAVKGSELAAWNPETIKTFITAMRGTRTFGVFGSLYGKRTEWKDWLKTIADTQLKCKCGCSEFRFFTEQKWLERDLIPDESLKPRPPPELQIEFQLL